jgi:hypothetical protein
VALLKNFEGLKGKGKKSKGTKKARVKGMYLRISVEILSRVWRIPTF